jgi:hypothetical protein
LGTALVAVACVALRNASPTWVSALLSLALVAPTAAIALAIFRQAGQRAFWVGFAMFGWAYLLLLAYSWSLDPNTSQSNPLRPYSLLTTQLSQSGYNRIYSRPDSVNYYVTPDGGSVTFSYPLTHVTGTVSNGPYTEVYSSNSRVTTSGDFSFYVGTGGTKTLTTIASGLPQPAGTSPPSQDDFINVAHALWAILIALCGGYFTCWLYATRTTQSKTLPETSTTTA